MEFDEIKGCWQEEGKRISENVRINKDASFQKLRSSFEKVRIRRLFHLIVMCISVPLILVLIVFPRLKNDGTMWFYISLITFFTPIIISFFAYIYYYIRLQKIDFSASLQKAQKEILCLEIFEKRLSISGYIIVPIITLCTFKIFGIPFNQKAILFIVLIAISMIVGAFTRLKVLIPKEYSKVKSYLEDMKKEE